jgi:hypothetical protein
VSLEKTYEEREAACRVWGRDPVIPEGVVGPRQIGRRVATAIVEKDVNGTRTTPEGNAEVRKDFARIDLALSCAQVLGDGLPESGGGRRVRDGETTAHTPGVKGEGSGAGLVGHARLEDEDLDIRSCEDGVTDEASHGIALALGEVLNRSAAVLLASCEEEQRAAEKG